MPNVLELNYDFNSLSVRDLLEARDLYHFHLMSKANVVGTAVGLYLIRTEEEWPSRDKKAKKLTFERTLGNSEVRDYSWPCVLVFVSKWIDETDFKADGTYHPTQIVPKTLFMPDGRAVPVCVVKVTQLPAGETEAITPRSWPHTRLGGGLPVLINIQQQRHVATIGCLVSDGHLTYALTARHACGEPGTMVLSQLREGAVPIGVSSAKQLTRLPFSEVYKTFPGLLSYLNLDVGLVRIDDLNAWTSNIFGLPPLGPLADIYEQNLTLKLVDQPVVAFGAASGLLNGKIKALFYRYRSVGGYDYVGDFLIAPADKGRSTRHGDSGAVWHLDVTGDRKAKSKKPPGKRDLRPLAIEWGGQALDVDGTRSNFAIATSLSNVCKLLDVELVNTRNRGVSGYWGRTGHYSIAALAIPLVKNTGLKPLLEKNAELLSFDLDTIAGKGFAKDDAKAEFVRLADVPDDVWKHWPESHHNGIKGGRDTRLAGFRTTGPEHPNHYADIDVDYKNNMSLRRLCLQNDTTFLTVAAWQQYYRDLAERAQAAGDVEAKKHAQDPFKQGLLPFRVWQFFDEMRQSVGKPDRFVTAAGLLAHYVGDACQPLHGSAMSDGDTSRPIEGREDKDGKQLFYGSGAHSAFESDMLDVAAGDGKLIPAIQGQLPSNGHGKSLVTTGRGAAKSIVQLMDDAAGILPPQQILDAYENADAFGTKALATRRAMWQALGNKTAKVMAEGVMVLAMLWDSAWAAGVGSHASSSHEVDPDAATALYCDEAFLQSYTLDKIGPVLK